MNSIDFVIQELNLFVEQFPKTRVRYEFDEKALVHVVEVVPNEVYHLDDAYVAWEEQMFNKFIGFFPSENICFISDDALVGIESPVFIKNGKEYESILYTTAAGLHFNQQVNYVVVIKQGLQNTVESLTIASDCNKETLKGIYYSYPQAA